MQQRVVGVGLEDDAKAWTLEAISGGEARVTNDAVGETRIVIFWTSGQSTALEADSVAGGRDVGSSSVFLSRVGDRVLAFATVGGHFIDDQTGSEWNIAGEAVAGELEGTTLERIVPLGHFLVRLVQLPAWHRTRGEFVGIQSLFVCSLSYDGR